MRVDELGVMAAADVAFRRVRAMVERPLRVRRGAGLSAAGVLTKVGVWAIPLLLLGVGMVIAPAMRREWWAWALASAFVLAAVGLLYLGSRMQLMLFGLLLEPTDRAGAAWRRAGTWTWRWIGVQCLVLLPVGLALLLVVGAPLLRGFRLLMEVTRPGAPQPSPMLPLVVFAAELSVFAAFGVLAMMQSLLADFAMPFVAVDGLAVAGALRAGAGLVCAHAKSVAAYVGFSLVLALGGAVAQNMVGFTVALIVGALLGAVGLVGWLLLHAVVTQTVLYVGAAVLYGAFILSAVISGTVVIGAVVVFLEAYAMCFVGSRHEAMGERMGLPVRVPPPPLGVVPPPPFSGLGAEGQA